MVLINEGKEPVNVPNNMSKDEARKLVRQQHGLGNKTKHSSKEVAERKKRRDIKNRKIAVCLGCGKPNYQCICKDHKTPSFETQITYNWNAKKN